MSDFEKYNIDLNVKFQPLELIDIHQLVSENDKTWFNQTLTKVNDSVIRLGALEGDFHWHKHENDDEFFYVVSGRLIIDIENEKSIELFPGQGVTVPRDLLHRPRAIEKTVILMVETSAIQPTGD